MEDGGREGGREGGSEGGWEGGREGGRGGEGGREVRTANHRDIHYLQYHRLDSMLTCDQVFQ